MGACSSLMTEVKEDAPDIQKAKVMYDDRKHDQELGQMLDDLESKGEPHRLEQAMNDASDPNLILTQQSLLKSYYDPLVRAYDPKRPNESINQAINKYGGLLSRVDTALVLSKENQEIHQHRVNIETLGRMEWLKEGVNQNRVTMEMYELMNRYYEPFFVRYSASTNPNAKNLIQEVQPLMKSAQDQSHEQGFNLGEFNRGFGGGSAMAGLDTNKSRANSLPSATVVGRGSSNEMEQPRFVH